MKKIMLTSCLVCIAGAAYAQDEYSVNVGVSTLGLTIEGGYRISPSFGVRGIIGYAAGDFSKDIIDTPDVGDSIPVVSTVAFGGVGVMLDYYIFEGGACLGWCHCPLIRC